MKMHIRLSLAATIVPFCLVLGTGAFAQPEMSFVEMGLTGGAINEVSIVPDSFQDSASTTHLDNAVAALEKGDKAATTQELKAGIAGLEAEAQQKPTSFKDKLLSQASKLKALLPLIPTGALGNGALAKAVSLAKLASGGNKLEGILAAGSLLGKGSQLTSGLSGIGSALSALGGGTQSTGQSLISTALGTVGKLDQGGLVAKAAEPAAKTQLTSVLNFVKGAL
ncbi:hypothetical protein [Spirosoma terrae]|uniref:hypothetical protein n=1 Tax=Spirosoma terrae TaxID=1968276 RepID=UPI001FE557BE|nr:hypothetical protein [Spirosoma terrae]